MHALVSLQNCQHFLILTLYETKKFRGCRLMPIFLSSLFLSFSFSKDLIHPHSLAIAGDGTPVVTSHRERKKRVCDCKEKGITDWDCDRYFSRPDRDIGWDSSNDRWYHGLVLCQDLVQVKMRFSSS